MDIHPRNLEIPEQIALFQDPDVYTHLIEESFLEDHLPIGFSSSDDSKDPIKFYIRGTEHWIDWTKSYIVIKGEFSGQKKDSNDNNRFKDISRLKNESGFSFCDSFFHSLFSSIQVKINDTLVTVNNDNYPYIAQIQNACNLSSDYQSTIGTVLGLGKTSTNRIKLLQDDNNITGILQIKSPMFMSLKNLYSFLNVDITMNRTTEQAFYLRATNSTDYKVQFKLKSIVFRVRKLRIQESYNNTIEKWLTAGNQITYNWNDSRVLTKTYVGIGPDIIEDTLFHGVLPKRIIIGMVDSSAFRGDLTKDPFKFEPFNISEIGLFVNGQSFPLPMLSMDFTTKDTSEGYYCLMDSLHAINSPDPPLITKSDFDTGGYTLFGFNMSPDQYHSLDSKNLFNRPASIRLHMKFRNHNPNAAMTLVIYYELYSSLSFNKLRQVTFHSK